MLDQLCIGYSDMRQLSKSNSPNTSRIEEKKDKTTNDCCYFLINMVNDDYDSNMSAQPCYSAQLQIKSVALPGKQDVTF